MRAIYYKDIESSNIQIEGDSFHHLKNVVRVKENDSLLLLNGLGSGRKFQVESLQKRSLSLIALEETHIRKKEHELSLAICQLKKDAMDLSIKQAVELGARKIIILESEYSQNYKLNFDRLEKLAISALEQSNSYFLPQFEQQNLKNLGKEQKNIFYLSLSQSERGKTVENFLDGIILIGPEGGFSVEEDHFICQNFDPVTVKLPTNILRAPTAVAASFGYLLGRDY